MIESQHLKLNRILLLLIGLWPFQQSNLIRFQFIVLSIIHMTSIMCQLTTFVTTKCTPDRVINVLSSVFMFSFCAIKYNLFPFNMETMKDLLVQLETVCNELKDKNEITIMKKYSYNAKRFTFTLILFGAFVVFSSVTILSGRILLNILSMNVSLSYRLPIRMEYFIDQEKYFYLISLHISMAMCIGTFTTIAIGALYIAYMLYICGMFRISCYRFKRAMHINMLQNIKAENLILEGIISAVDMHRQAMKLVFDMKKRSKPLDNFLENILSKLLISTIQTTMFCLVMLGVVILSFSLFRIFQIMSTGDDFKEFIIPSLFVSTIILYLFVANYYAQDVTDHNNDIFETLCNVQWYAAPLHIQKLLLFLLQRGSKDFTLSVGGFFVGSLQYFATLLKASFSYFTFMHSMQ